MTHFARRLAVGLALLAASPVWAQDGQAAATASSAEHTAAAEAENSSAESTAGVLKVGVRQNPPFVIRSDNGDFDGIAIELWNQIADDLGMDFEYLVASDVGALLQGVGAARYDVGAGALTVTASRAETVDFTQPFYRGEIGIATRQERGLLHALGALFSLDFLKAIAALMVVLLLVGVLVWLFERHRNPEQFGGSTAQGIGSGFWWSAVTMTTVGYGDKAPASFGGRVIGLVWMFASIITISGFTAAIASSITVGRLTTQVSGVSDLPRVRVASVAGSTSEDFARGEGLAIASVADPAEALRRLSTNQVDAVLYDAPILQSRIFRQKLDRLTVLPELVREEDYALALPRDSRLRKPINQALLRVTEAPQWQETLDRYLGAQR